MSDFQVWPVGFAPGPPNGVLRPIRLIPTRWLCGVVRSLACNRRHKPEDIERLFLAKVQEIVSALRARPQFEETHWTERLVPLPCHCGKPGLYLVRRTTYCREHREQAVQRRATRDNAIREALRSENDPLWLEREDREKRATHLRRCKQGHR